MFRRILLGMVVLLAFYYGACRWRERYGNFLKITFLDVHQGDSALVEFPAGKRMLIDAGGGFGETDVGSRVLVRELARKSILQLDAAVLTHPDQDHGYGFRGILGELQVSEFWFHLWSPKPLFHELTELAGKRGTRLRPFVVPQTLTFGLVEVAVLPLGDVRAKSNDQPLAIEISFAGCRALFTADIEAPGEGELVRRRKGRVTILKVPHHGSKTSSSSGFLRAFSPRFAVISTGLGNRYGHPHAHVVERYADLGISLFRTDFHGFVEFTISPSGQIACRTYHGSCGVSVCAN